jgi:hypothetical protein
LHVQEDADHPVDRVVDKKRIIGKRRVKEEESHKGPLTHHQQQKRLSGKMNLVLGAVSCLAPDSGW